MTAEAYVISDLHLGSGPGDALEDFFADEQLATFVVAMQPAETTLVINGDFVDFAQIEPLDPSTLPDGLLWDEDTSLLKLEKALSRSSRGLLRAGRLRDRGWVSDRGYRGRQPRSGLRLAQGAGATSRGAPTTPTAG